MIGRRGYFESLTMYAAAVFNRSSCDTILRPGSTGLLVWSQDSIHATEKVSFPGCEGLPDKQLRVVCCLFELLYELCIAPANDKSESPGFETPLGVFGARE